YQIPDTRYQIPDTRYQIPDTIYLTKHTMLFATYCNYLSKLEQTASRLELAGIVSELLLELKKEANPEELKLAVYLLQGSLTPSYLKLEFNFSTKLLLRALSSYFAVNKDLAERYQELGDEGNLLEELTKNQIASPFTITELQQILLVIARKSGKDSQEFKQQKYRELIRQLSSLEAKYVTRIVLTKLRLGVSDKTIIDAISWAVTGDKELSERIERLFGINSDLGLIAQILLTKGIDSAEDSFKVQPGIPIAAKLVQREKKAEAVFARMPDCLIQPKLDGLRMQIHFHETKIAEIYDQNLSESEFSLISEPVKKTRVKIYSRNLEDITAMFPDVVAAVESIPDLKGMILDCETIGFNPENQQLLNFQETIKRKRKHNVVEKSSQIPVKVFAFDLLYLDNSEYPEQDLTRFPLIERTEILQKVLKASEQNTIKYLETNRITDLKILEKTFAQYVAHGLEGLIAKNPLSIYEPGTRNFEWIKLKAASHEELADTIDAVILGYYAGVGSRTKLGIGALLLGTYDPTTEIYYTVAKLGTGVTEAQWIEIKKTLDQYKTSALPDNVKIDKTLLPDVLVTPKIVVEVEADEVTKSKMHGAGVTPGFSLRFPRLKIFGRDKNPEQITNILELQRLFELRKKN
ncbi:MAG: ATP-dependent DNA ligase, partial [bacterium]